MTLEKKLKGIENEFKKLKTNNLVELILKEYQSKLNVLNTRLQKINKKTKTDYEIVFNQDLIRQDYSDIQGVLVADNPGKNEKIKKEYFIGNAGKLLENQLKRIGQSKSNYLIFNKTTISTPATQDLKELYLKNNKDTKNQKSFKKLEELFLIEQELTAKTIFKIHKLIKKPMLVFGYSNYHNINKQYKPYKKKENNQNFPANTKPLHTFFNMLNKEYNKKSYSKLKKEVFFFYHPSNNALNKQLTQMLKTYEKEKKNEFKLTYQLFLKFGKKNRRNFF